MKTLLSVSLVAVICAAAVSARAQLTVSTLPTSGLSEPTGLAEDADGNLFLADSVNNRIVRLDRIYLTESVLAGTGVAGNADGFGISATFNNPQGLLFTGTNTLLVADAGNNLIRAIRMSDGYVTTLAGQTNAGPAVNSTGTNATFHFPANLAQDNSGNIYIADWGNDAIRVMNLNDPALGVTNLTISGAKLTRPAAVAYGNANQLWVADSGPYSDNTIRLLTFATPTTASLTSFLGGNSVHVAAGFKNSAVGGTNVLFNNPHGLLWVSGTGLLICDSGNNCLRLATNNPIFGATNYAVTTFAGVPLSPGTADGSVASATFTSPNSIVANSVELFYVTDNGTGLGSPLRSLQNGNQDFSTVRTPMVGYLTVQMDPFSGTPILVLTTNLPQIFYNDPVIAVGDDSGITIDFTYGSNSVANPIPDPSVAAPQNTTPAFDIANSSGASLPASIMAGKPLTPSLMIKAIGVAPATSSRPPSSVAVGQFIFQTGSVQNVAPDVLDPFHVQLSCLTSNAVVYYTFDGSNPVNNTNRFKWDPATIYLKIPEANFTNHEVTLKAFARRAGYYDSGVFSQVFDISNAVYDVAFYPNFGYYPMGHTIQVTCPGTNVFYTVDGTEPTTNSSRVENIVANIGYIHWFNTTNDLSSLRVKAFVSLTNAILSAAGQISPVATIGTPTDFNPQLSAGIGSSVVIPVVCNLAIDQQIQSYQFRAEISPANNANTPTFLPLNIFPTNDFVPLVTVAANGTVASYTATPYTVGVTNGLEIFALGNGNHILFRNFAVVALFEVQIPYVANVGDTYTLNILWPSATSDGFSTPVPLTAMPPITILVTNLPYTVGDVASSVGAWYDAGTFGDNNLDNADVNPIFDAASGLRVPYAFSDLFNAMDAYPADYPGAVGGDGQIRFLDWQTILDRSLRLDTNNWSRIWSAGGNVIDFMTNLTPKSLAFPATKASPQIAASWPWYRQILVGAQSVGNATPGATVAVPVYVQVANGCSLSGLQFRAVVQPQTGAPALTAAPQLTLASGAPSPLLTQSFKAGETAFGWPLGSFSCLSRSSNFLGWVSFPVPTNALTGQTYQVSLLNADGSPNLATQYDFETRSATVAVNTLAPPTSVCSDEWKIHFFGSLTNPAAADNADPDHDGVPNWVEYLTGTDPTNPQSQLQMNVSGGQTIKGQQQFSMHWLTAPGHAYEVQWSSNLIGGVWRSLATVSGDGSLTSLMDTNQPGLTRYYRLHILQ